MARMWTKKVNIEVDTKDVNSLRNAMRFKAENPEANADPEIYYSVVEKIDILEDVIRTYQAAIHQYIEEGKKKK